MSEYLERIRAKLRSLDGDYAKFGQFTDEQKEYYSDLRQKEGEELKRIAAKEYLKEQVKKGPVKSSTVRQKVMADNVILDRVIDNPALSDKQRNMARKIREKSGGLTEYDVRFIESMKSQS